MSPNVRELLQIKEFLHATKAPYEDSQKRYIFDSRCTIEGKVCDLTIDGESCTNMASNTLIKKL